LKKYCGEKYDGLNLLSALRNKFIEAMCENKWGNMPPKPINCKKDWKRKWLEYAKDYESKFKKFLGKRIGGRVLRHSEGARVV